MTTSPVMAVTRMANSVLLSKGEKKSSRPKMPEPILLEWLTLVGLFVFAAWLLGVEGVWGLLLTADPTGITFIIILVFTVGTFWCGTLDRELSLQREKSFKLHADTTGASDQTGWVAEYLTLLRSSPKDPTAPIDLLLERTHGPHSTAWWVNGIQLKLGLLGKVIGFSILALEIGNIESFDPSESQELLKNLTAGLGVALLTTMVGLIGNILLGLQLTRLDRYADDIVSRAQLHAMQTDSQQIRDEGTG